VCRRPLVLAAAFAIHVWTGSARAQASGADRALAQSLFDEGRKQMQSGQLADGCAKLERSEALDASGGTMLNLALCHEKQGKTATAWAEYHDALAMARKDQRDERVEFAQKHIALLDAALSRLTISIALDGLPVGLEILRNGAPLAPAAWNTAAPVDPGPHEIVVRAHGYEEWRASVIVGPTADAKTVEIPPLRRSAAATPLTPPEVVVATPAAPRPSGASIQRPLGFALLGLGAVAAGVGIGFGVHALASDGNAHNLCGSDTTCSSAAGLDATRDAVTSAKAADGLIIGGLGVAAAGLAIALTAGPRRDGTESSAPATSLLVTPRRVGLSLRF
jgi:hypothetical protein